MAVTIMLSCVFGFLVLSISGQCVPLSAYNYGVYGGTGCACNEHLAAGAAAGALSAADGGGFAVTSASPTSPYGVSVVSDNEYSGIVAVVGQLPFLGTTYLEGAVPSAGAGTVTYGCGSGDVSIVSEDFAGTTAGLGNTNGLILGRGYDLRGCGCGSLY